ncbi:MAG: Holliday junction branch migration protein RuvA [Candidatus Wallbacteria bacterium]
MIHFIRGKLIEKQKENIIVETGGIAYEISFLASSFGSLPELESEVTVYTQFLPREDCFYLYGFLSREEKNFFNTLTSVPSIGPKTAFNIMGSVSIEKLIEAILREDEKCLTQISGIGPKTAKRIILELKDKLSKLHAMSKDEKTGTAAFGAASSKAAGSALDEARMALGSLGFSYGEIEKMISNLLKERELTKLTTEDIIKFALKRR